ncbi:MAG: TolC family protein [Akkermansia sp.]|nr:TolC family protein [Akkermansia sp.]
MIKKTQTAVLAAMVLAGCVQYTPKPVDLRADDANWRQLTADMCKSRRSMSPAELRRVGLLMNPELLKARLSYAKSQGKAEYAGLWDDPSMGLEFERVFALDINNHSLSPTLALPVTGLPALRKQIAEQYTEVDYWTMRDKERSYMAELDVLCYKLMAAEAKLGLMRRRLAALRDEQQRMTRLLELGEVAFADYQTGTERLNETIKQVQEQETEQLALQQQLVSSLGVHPSVTGLKPSGRLPHGVPAAVSAPSADTMLALPVVKAAMAGYGAVETELRAEIRKQYPELGISGLYGVEDDNEKMVLGVEFSLPLWNRNREAIATSTGEREIKQAETIQAWRELVQKSSALAAQQKLLLTHCRSEYSRLIELESATEQQEKLFNLGESKLLELAEARHLTYERKLAYLDCLVNLLATQTQLRYLNPSYNQQ